MITGILETALYVNDLDAAEHFYGNILGLEQYSRLGDRSVFFRVGAGMLLLFNAEITAKIESYINGGLIPVHGSVGAGHVAFTVAEAELVTMQAALETAGVEIESVVTWPNGAKSVYFRDPAGNSLEIASGKLWGIDIYD